jgi:aminopeptidase-like protein
MEVRVINNEVDIDLQMHQLVAKAFPVCRSITGNGVRETLRIISDIIPLSIYEVPSGTSAFDWSVPKEWNIQDAYIADEKGNKVIDFKQHNLHVVGYSTPIDQWITLSELQEHLHSLPEQPNAIPYVTSYYKERWGFCISHGARAKLKDGKYHVYIDSTLEEGSLTYGECLLKGETEQEIFLSTYVCHPSMANNELSGPVVTAFIAKWLASLPRKYTYRIIFIPETIGSIVYLSRNLDTMKKNVIAGFNISCVGDDMAYSYVASRYENTLADEVASNVLSFKHPKFIKYSFLDRGSDERQYCSPGVDLPLVTLSRSKYGTYPEYHTSLDNLDFVTPEGLLGGYGLVQDCINVIENNRIFRVNCYAEPQLGKRGLYPNLSTKKSDASVEVMMDFIAYADGNNDLLQISNIIHKPVWEIVPIAEKLLGVGLLEEIKEKNLIG